VRFPHRRVHPETIVDYRHEMTIVATIGEVGHERMLGVASYHRNPQNAVVECAFTVHENHRRLGIGTALLKHLTLIARESGDIDGFSVDVLARNKPMLDMIHHYVDAADTRDGIHTQFEEGVCSLWYFFRDE